MTNTWNSIEEVRTELAQGNALRLSEAFVVAHEQRIATWLALILKNVERSLLQATEKVRWTTTFGMFTCCFVSREIS